MIMLRLRSLRRRLVVYLCVKRFVLHTGLLSILSGLQHWRAEKKERVLKVRIIRVVERKVILIR